MVTNSAEILDIMISNATPSNEHHVMLSVHFYSPYSNHSQSCTGCKMISAGLAEEVSISKSHGIVLSPFAKKTISRQDYPRVLKYGIHVLDCPWEILESLTIKYMKSGSILRKLPDSLEPTNPYYRQVNPLYYSDRTKFSTAEAAAYGLAASGLYTYGREIARKLEFLDAYLDNIESL